MQEYCRNGKWGKFLFKLMYNDALLSARDAEGHTPMHWFAHYNQLEAVKKLLSIGGEVYMCAAVLNAPSRVCGWLLQHCFACHPFGVQWLVAPNPTSCCCWDCASSQLLLLSMPLQLYP
jgi:ankyrin repeat protein